MNGARAMAPSFELLLATHDGERFLPALLESVLAQEFAGFTILARDDGSTDATPAILGDYAGRHPGRLRILPPSRERGGACANFAALLDAAEADFVFLCDQDDVWLPGKMKLTYARMEELVASYGAETPLLVHTDLAITGPDLQPLADSIGRYCRIDHARSSLSDLLLSNVATGCTMLVNRALYALARPVPANVLMHDHWLAQVAAATGAILFEPTATILYRQHDDNTLGVQPANLADFATRVVRTLFTPGPARVLRAYCDQAALLLDRCGERMDPRERAEAATLATIWAQPRLSRLPRLWRAGLRKRSLAGNVALFLLLLRKRPAKPAERPRWATP